MKRAPQLSTKETVGVTLLVPIAKQGERPASPFLELFTVNICNENTQGPYVDPKRFIKMM
jgi:hypothetical protein